MTRLWLTRSAQLDHCWLEDLDRKPDYEYAFSFRAYRVEVDPADLRLMRRFHANRHGMFKWSEVKHLVHEAVDGGDGGAP